MKNTFWQRCRAPLLRALVVVLIAAANDLALTLDRELIALDANKRVDLARSGLPQPGFAAEEAEAQGVLPADEKEDPSESSETKK